MTKVTAKTATLAAVALVLATLSALAVDSAAPQTTPALGPAESLYLKLRSVGLDGKRVYKIRRASLERGKLHISLDDGTIAFTEDVGGHTTGAFFKGYGEVLLMPGDEIERSSLALFTGGAILEETFSNAYFRFNDDVYGELQGFLRPADDAEGFRSEFDLTARNLAAEDALRLVTKFSDTLPPAVSSQSTGAADRMLHAYLEGNKLGIFDVRYDSLMSEQIDAGQHRRVQGDDYYDLWTSFSSPAMNGAKASSPPPSRRPRDFDVIHYTIRAQIRPVKQLEAQATLTLEAHQRTRRALVFELSRLLTVKQVRSEAQILEFIHNQALEGSELARRGNDLVAVILPAPLEKGQRIQLTFDYAGEVLSEAADGLLYVGEHGTWYPNRGFAMANFDMEFHYPVGWTLVATGRRQQTKTLGAEQVSTWQSERPVPVAGFNLGRYTESATRVGKVLVTTYATRNVERNLAAAVTRPPPELPIFPRPGNDVRRMIVPRSEVESSPADNAQVVGRAAAQALDFYARYFGPYPYGELAITQMPGTLSQGWPGLIFLSSYAFLDPEERARLQMNPRERLVSDEIIAHETAHQWWGDLVSWNSYHDQWIMEGLANYSALLLLEGRDRAKFRQILEDYRQQLLDKNAKGVPLMDAGPVTLGFRLSSSQFPGAYEPICYGRGTWLMHMLRTMLREGTNLSSSRAAHPSSLSDEPFLRALKKLRQQYEGKEVSNQDLMHVFEAELPRSLWYQGKDSLDWFYEGWLNGKAIPMLSLRDVKFTGKGNGTVVSGTIVQEQAPDTLVTPVPLYASIAGKPVFLGLIFAEGSETTFRVSAPGSTRRLLIDPHQSLLAREK